MTYIKTGIHKPGIIELLNYKRNTGHALSNLAHALLMDESPLSSAEREIIASYVSYLNDCEFCHESHAAAANEHLGDQGTTILCLKENFGKAKVSDKLKMLLKIAAKVSLGGKHVKPEDVEMAKSAGAKDEEIHDTVLIAAAFCMFNRYVDGLGTSRATPDEYKEMAKRMKNGYKMTSDI